MDVIAKSIYSAFLKSKKNPETLGSLVILLDPEKIELNNLALLISKIKNSPATHLFIGGSIVENNSIDTLIILLKREIDLPIVLFPGNPSQISNEADAILFLSLISGRNPDFLIGHQVNAVPVLRKSQLEIISTGYLLIDSGAPTAVERVSKTKPIARNDLELALATAQAGEMLGNKLIYLEAGSGAKQAVPLEMIRKIANNIQIPLIVGGGIINLHQIKDAFDSGANVVVIGTAFENDLGFFDNYQ
jgi:phosphoglycerol geranylgeranyltransferase